MNCLCRNGNRIRLSCRSTISPIIEASATTPPSSSARICIAKRCGSDGPLTVRSRNVPLKKTNAADEIARTKFDLLDPVTITEMPRAQQRFVRQLDKYNRERVRQMFAKNKQMILWGWGLGAGCLSIYLYTMWVLRRETFLEEIDEEVAIERGELQVDDQGKPVKLAEK